MRARLAACALLVLTLPGVERGLEACGDKFLLLHRGTRFERPSMRRIPATIVAYARQGSGLPQALADLPVAVTLTRAGYTFSVVTTPEELDAAVGRGAIDLVLADLIDAPALAGRLTSVAAPVVLPVVFGRTTAETRKALDGFTCAVKSPRRQQSFLDAVDEALDARRRPSSGSAR